MRIRLFIALLVVGSTLAGCTTLDESHCLLYCRTQHRSSSSLVEYLYPEGQVPPSQNAIPQLRLPLRIGLGFLPRSASDTGTTLDAAQREQLLERIRTHFKDRPFVADITLVPDYYLSQTHGFASLESVQRLYGLDLLALVSYDQVDHQDDNRWSLGYLTIVGAYVLPGTHQDISSLIDLAVVDPSTRSLVLRAGGADTRSRKSTLIDAGREARAEGNRSFVAATDQTIEHLDTALTTFEQEVRSGKARVQVVARSGGGGGAFEPLWLLVLLPCAVVLMHQRRAIEGAVRARTPASSSYRGGPLTENSITRPSRKHRSRADVTATRGYIMRRSRLINMKPLLRSVMRLLFRVSVTGDPRVCINSRTLIVANHESLLDGLLLRLFLPVDATFVVHEQVARSWLFRQLLRVVPHLLVDSASPLAMKQIVRLVESGTPVVIFPEGRLTTTGSLMKVYDGAGFVAARTGATVVPVRLEGSGRSYFGRLCGIYPRSLLPKVRIALQPRRFIAMPKLPSAKQRRRRAGELMRRVLLDMLVAARPRRTLFEAFLDAKDSFGSGYRLIEDVRMQEESYGSMLRMALGLARWTKNFTQPGENIGVLTPNAAPTLALILGASSARRVPAMLNYTAGAEGLRSACIAAQIRNVVTSRSFVEKAKLAPVLESLSGITLHYLEDAPRALSAWDRLAIVVQQFFARAVAAKQAVDDPAIVLFTSGSEGRPKGVVHTHDSILSNVAQIRAVADFTPLDKFMIALPLFHSFGLTCGVIMPLVSGSKVFLYPTPLHYRVIPELVYDRNCTVLFGTSTFLGNYGKYAHPYDFGRLRYVVAGAEKLSQDVRALWIDKFGIRVLEGYGITECAPVIAVNVPMACRVGSVGQILPGLDYRLEPVAGVERGGVLQVRGPNIMRGYLLFDSPGVITSEGALNDGWYNTGDIVAMDDDDFVQIMGRVKRFAKIAGEMISLEVVERMATSAAPGFAHAASTRSDSAKGEAIVLFTTAKELTRDLLLSSAKALGAPELAVPRIVRLIGEIPLLGTGKTDYVRLKAMAESAA
jgi:acyl-[acyl-carrier-protein]-phospholipid O-acyltransferase/long-chain-fatty-acid--[acyl-carrier-protein] ligase